MECHVYGKPLRVFGWNFFYVNHTAAHSSHYQVITRTSIKKFQLTRTVTIKNLIKTTISQEESQSDVSRSLSRSDNIWKSFNFARFKL